MVSEGNRRFRRRILRENPRAVHAGQHHVEHDSIEFLSGTEQAADGVFTVAQDFDRMSFGLEVEAQAVGEMRFILDDQDAAHAALLGSSRVTVVPRASPALSAKTFPPCARAMARTMKRPRPVPLA